MTAQMPDQFFYKDMKLDLVGIKGSGLYTPEDFDIKTVAASTACYRGYVMRYVFTEKQLILDGFWLNVKDTDPPIINGINPIKKSREINTSEISMYLFFNYEYRNLNIKIPFTGSIWLGKDFIDSQYVHMGFQNPSAYKTVLKFDIENGDIVNMEDRSKQAEDVRVQDSSKGAHPKSNSPNDIEDWIKKRFSLDPKDRLE